MFLAGVNLSHWFAQAPPESREDLSWDETWINDTDLRLIAAAGFDHVRLPFDLNAMRSGPDSSLERAVARVDRAVRRALSVGLGVVLDSHPQDPVKHALRDFDDAVGKYCRELRRLAQSLNDAPPELLVWEPLNEPSFWDRDRWQVVQSRLIAELDDGASRTILACGDGYSSINDLVATPVSHRERLLHTFHLYDPMVISHQGAPWSPEWLRDLRGLSYPVEEPNALQLARYLTGEARERVEEYARTGWNDVAYARYVDTAVRWAGGAPLMCSEFGIHPRHASREMRARWIADVTKAFRNAGIGWSIWDYAGDFAIATGPIGQRSLDPMLVGAMRVTARDD